MALPLKERPLCFRISSEIYRAVFEAIGAASMCWKPRPKQETFSSEEASKVAVDLCFKIANDIEDRINQLEAALQAVEKERDRLRTHVIEFLNDWKKGDFQLSELAACDARAMEEALQPAKEQA